MKATPCCHAKPGFSGKTVLVERKWVKQHKCPGCDRLVLATELVSIKASELKKPTKQPKYVGLIKVQGD